MLSVLKSVQVNYSSCYWFVYTELCHGKSSRAHKLSCSSCSTNLVINWLYNFNTSELYCVFFVSPLLCFVIHFIASFVCLWLSVCLFAAVMVNKDLCTTASGPIQPIQDDSTDSAISVTPLFLVIFWAPLRSRQQLTMIWINAKLSQVYIKFNFDEFNFT